MMKSIILLLSNTIAISHAFITPSIRNILSNNAIITTILKEVNKELLDESTIVSELNNIEGLSLLDNNGINDLLIGIPFYSFMFIVGIMYENDNRHKIHKIDVYQKSSNRTRTLLLILILVFNRHIENAI